MGPKVLKGTLIWGINFIANVFLKKWLIGNDITEIRESYL